MGERIHFSWITCITSNRLIIKRFSMSEKEVYESDLKLYEIRSISYKTHILFELVKI